MQQNANPLLRWTITDLWPWLQPAGIFSQPILPGWSATVNINSHNSTAPMTELAVLEQHSYGRQLGRISDALRALLLAQPSAQIPDKPGDGPIGQFLSMWEDIEQVKTGSAAARLDQIASDLARLKEKNPGEYKRLRDALGKALDQTG